jgi:polysaccharide biosynthesis protein PslH
VSINREILDLLNRDATHGESIYKQQKLVMRLLYFAAHKAWPLISGNRLRDYHLAQALAKRASVTFVEMCHEGEQPTSRSDGCAWDRIVSLKKPPSYTLRNIARGIAGPAPLSVLNYFEPQLESELARLLDEHTFDTAQIEGIHLSRYLAALRSARNPPAILVDWHNIESELMWRYSENAPSWAKRLLARRTAQLLEKAELQLLETCDAHTVASNRERDKLLALCPFAKIHVVPNGVDIKHFSPESTGAQRSPSPGVSKHDLLFVGSMDYHPNVDAATWFVNDIWPAIARRYPEFKFVIVGRNPSKEVLRLRSDRVRVTGTVEDVRPFYASALAVVVPLRIGGGTRLKILEAMAAGVPVISTRLGAEGIDAEHDVHILLADTRSDIANAIHQVVSSPNTRVRLVDAARNLAETRYDWAVLGERLHRIHNDLMPPRG